MIWLLIILACLAGHPYAWIEACGAVDAARGWWAIQRSARRRRTRARSPNQGT